MAWAGMLLPQQKAGPMYPDTMPTSQEEKKMLLIQARSELPNCPCPVWLPGAEAS